jgi:SAM-dependent methyltransferase
MIEQYDTAVAEHYAAFRPPLHRLILERLIRPGDTFSTGLDIGCGTGYSAVALAGFCDRVVGIDSSAAMLEQAQPHPHVIYLHASGEQLSHVLAERVDAVTFAGSLFYTKSEKLRTELAHVCRSGATILVYDFEVLLDAIVAELGLSGPPVASGYDYAVNLSDWAELSLDAVGRERIGLDVSADDLAHVLLADSNRYAALKARFPVRDVFSVVAGHVGQRTARASLAADIYFARYRAG